MGSFELLWHVVACCDIGTGHKYDLGKGTSLRGLSPRKRLLHDALLRIWGFHKGGFLKWLVYNRKSMKIPI